MGGSKSVKVVEPRIPKRRLLAGQQLIIEMEEQLHEKKLKLLDLQISREERSIAMDQEYHEKRMSCFNRENVQIVQQVEIIEDELPDI